LMFDTYLNSITYDSTSFIQNISFQPKDDINSHVKLLCRIEFIVK